MGLIVRALTRRNIVAIVAGVLLAGAPLVAFDFWLGGLIDCQGREEVDTSAKRASRNPRLASDRHTRRFGGARRRQPRRSIQCLCVYRHGFGRLDRQRRRAVRRCQHHIHGQGDLRKIRIRNRDIDAAQPRDCGPRRVAVARPVRHRRHHYDPGRVLHADAAAPGPAIRCPRSRARSRPANSCPTTSR